MAFDQDRDARRMRIGLLLAALALLGVLVAAGVQALAPPWLKYQEGFQSLPQARSSGPPAIAQAVGCEGLLERCTTCHPGIHRPDLAGEDVPRPYRAHPVALHGLHSSDLGCGVCHGGTGRALTVDTAHAMPGSSERDPLMTAPFREAACGRCHLPGAVKGTERLAGGARLYLELGCPVCHPLTAGGRGGADYGPDLRSLGRRGVAFLRASLLEPTANFAESTMPSFARAFSEHPENLEDLLIYLQTLALEPLASCSLPGPAASMARAPCADCHAGPAGKAAGRLAHRCTFILERRDHLHCAVCHPDGTPDSGSRGGFCPVVTRQRAACPTCHFGSPKSLSSAAGVD